MSLQNLLLDNQYLLFFSADAELREALIEKLDEWQNSDLESMSSATMPSTIRRISAADKHTRSKLSIIEETLHINSVSDSDMILYDLDLTNGDIEKAVKDIRRVKQDKSSKPLILIGEANNLKAALAQADVFARVSRSFVKPVTANQILSALQVAVGDMARSRNIDTDLDSARPPKNSKRVPLSIISTLAALVLCLAIFLSVSNSDEISNPGAATGSTNSPLFESDSANFVKPTPHLISDHPDIKKFNQLALAALEAGRILEPSNDCALYYFEKSLTIDSYEPVAYAGRQKIVDNVRASFAPQLARGHYSAASDTLSLLLELEPFSDQNRIMRQQLDQALARKLREQNSAPTVESPAAPIATVKPIKEKSQPEQRAL